MTEFLIFGKTLRQKKMVKNAAFKNTRFTLIWQKKNTFEFSLIAQRNDKRNIKRNSKPKVVSVKF